MQHETRKPLTIKQRTLLKSIEGFVIDNGYQPSMRELGTEFGITQSGIYEMLKLIEKKGYIEFTGKSRALKLLFYS